MKNITQKNYEDTMLLLYDLEYTSDSFYYEDSRRIQNVIKEQLGISISLVAAAKFWEDRSEQYDAGWLAIGPDNEILIEFAAYMGRCSAKLEPVEREKTRSPEEINNFVSDMAKLISDRVWVDINGECILRQCLTVKPI